MIVEVDKYPMGCSITDHNPLYLIPKPASNTCLFPKHAGFTWPQEATIMPYLRFAVFFTQSAQRTIEDERSFPCV